MTKRTKFIFFGLTILFVVLLGGVWVLSGKLNPIATQVVSTHQTVARKLENIGNLELVRFSMKDVVEEKIQREAFGQDFLLPDSKVLVIVSSDAVACVNLKKLVPSDIAEDGTNVRIRLPEPEICQATVDHTASKIYDVNLTARLLDPELIEDAYKNAEQKVKEKALDENILQKARTSATQLLVPLLQGLTDKTVLIEFAS